MLFGRRKDGFVKIEEITEFPTKINEDKQNQEKQDLLDYLESLDDEEELDKDIGPTLEEKDEPEIPRYQILAEFIRERSRGAHLTGKGFLESEEEGIEELLQALKEDENCQDIKTIKGEKDIYYYSTEFMTDNYAMIAVLVDEKDFARTIAKMVRWNCKTYPCPTPLYYFKNSPYHYTDEQIAHALNHMKNEYNDIREITTGNNVRYLYSSKIMSEKYARALAEGVEFGEYGY